MTRPSAAMRSASHGGTRPPWRGRSALPVRRAIGRVYVKIPLPDPGRRKRQHMRSDRHFPSLLTALGLTAALAAAAQSPPGQSDSNALAHDLLKELVEINTTDTPAGNVTTAA